MKMFYAVAIALLASSVSLAAQVQSAKLSPKGDKILIDVLYSGGCAEHTFELKWVGCAEVSPALCTAQLVDTTKEVDMCEAMISRRVVISLAKAKLNDPYFAGARLQILGDEASDKNAPKFIITLPK